MMRKFTRLSDKIDKKGYSFDPKKRVFRPCGDDKNKHAIIAVRRDTTPTIALSPTRENHLTKSRIIKTQVMMMMTTRRASIRAMRRKRAIIRRPSSSQGRKVKTR
jgi:hypothetical protein